MEQTSIQELMMYWGISQASVVKYFHSDSPRIVAKVSAGDRTYILKGIPDSRDGQSRGEQTICGNTCAHVFLGNQKGIAPRIFPTKGGSHKYYVKKDGYWFYLLEWVKGRPMQDTQEDELLLGRLARKLHTLEGYSLPSALDENKQRFYEWFCEKTFKAEFDQLLDKIPDFNLYNRCFIHTDLGPHNTIVRPNGEAVLIDLDDSGIGSRYLDIGWAFIMQFVEHTEQMELSYRFDLAQAFLKGYYGTAHISPKEYDLLWQGAIYMHISYMQSYGPGAVSSLWGILQFGLEQKAVLWELLEEGMQCSEGEKAHVFAREKRCRGL